VWNLLDEFRDLFIRISPQERFVLGAIESALLAKTYNVHEFYVEPNATTAMPGDLLETHLLDHAKPILTTIRKFLTDDSQRLLFVFGGYGSGKSALCAHLMDGIFKEYVNFAATYVALRQIASSDDLDRIVVKADQLAKSSRTSLTKSAVILDGVDEIHNAMQPAERRKNIMAICRSASKVDKLIVTVRTSYFRGMEEFWSLFERSEDNPLWTQMARLIPRVIRF
jgi:archaellum biogenesis ATPase FlaH